VGRRIAVDASVARQAADIIGVLQGYRAAKAGLPNAVVVQVGDNGPIEESQIAELKAVLRGVRRVVFVTVRVPRSWQDSNNELIHKMVQGWPQARLADWNAATVGKESLFDDGIHPDEEGQALYARTIERALLAP
jgi:lysophospholipase L1-like esterase